MMPSATHYGSTLKSALRRLDYLPPWLAIGMGVCLGLGVTLTPFSFPVAGAGFAVLLGVAVALAFSGEPITESVETVTPSQPSLVELVEIPAGVFRMGSTEYSEEQPVHEVHVPAFRCMRYPVTRRLYQDIMGSDPGWPEGKADERPVNNVSWYDAVEFCNRLSEREGLPLCYQQDADGTWHYDFAADGYRLPTEAEWEYACRAGTQTRYSFGDDEQQLGDYAWFNDNSGGQPHPVGKKQPNPWGLYDMHGNVWEWVQDCWHDSYQGAPTDGSAWETDQCQYRVLRGGSFDGRARNLRSAVRVRYWPGNQLRNDGFRCVRGAGRQP